MSEEYEYLAHRRAVKAAEYLWDLSGEGPQIRSYIKCGTCKAFHTEVDHVDYFLADDEIHYYTQVSLWCKRCGHMPRYAFACPVAMYYANRPDFRDADLREEDAK